MKRVLLSALALLCLLTFTYSNNLAFETDPNYVLVWSDEFDSDGPPDPTKWYHQTLFPVGTSWFNGELQHYTDETANSFVESGVLKIVAKKESYLDQGVTKDYTSARLNSKYAFTYGRVEVRAKLPSGAGTWPAIWTLGKNIDENGGFWDATYGNTAWPACGEIDIMEHWGSNQNFVQSAMHTPSSSGATVNKGGQTIATVSSDFHVYGLEWTEDKMVFDVDGVVHYTYEPATQDASTWPFDADQYILLNTAIEGNIAAVNPGFTEATMEIDYVRVYEAAPAMPGTEVVNLTFDDAGSTSGWSEVADATSADASFSWGDGLGETGGALQLTASNSTTDGKAYIFQYDASGLNYDGATDVQLTFDLKTVGALNGAAVHLQTNIPGPGVVNNFDLQTGGLNDATWTSYSFDFSSIDAAASTFSMHFNLASGAFVGAGGTLLIDNVVLTTTGGGGAATEPTASAPTPTQDAGDVISIFSDAYTDLAGTNFNPDWAQSTVVTTEMIDGGNVLKYANTNYQGTQLAGNNDLTGMDYLHVDMWTPDADVVQVTPINASGSPVEVLINLTPINIGEWNSYDIPLTDFTSGGMSINEVMQMKFDVQAGTTGTTLFLDNIYFYSSAPAATEPTASAPTPTQDAGDVISIFSDAYTDLAGTNFNPDWAQSTVVTTEMIDGGNVLKYANTNYQGTQLAGNNDLTGMDYLHVDMWTPDADVVQVTPINASGSPVEVLINLTPINIGEWNSYDIPLTDFTSGGMSINEVMQMKFDVQAGTTGTTLFLDNIYFYSSAPAATEPTASAPTPTQDAGDVISIFSDAYTDLAGTNFNPDWAQSTVVTTEMIDGGNVLKYANTNYQGTQLAGNNDLTGMDYLHVDMWTPDADVVQVTPINASGSPVEVLINLTPINIGEWNSYDIPLTDFTSGGMSINEVMQMKFDVQAGTTGTTLFLDNIYFYSSAPAATEPTASAPTPTQDAGDVISIFSDAYTDLAGTNFNPDWAQSTVVTTEMIDGGNVLKYANTNYQGTQLAGNNDLTGMDYLHVDMWTPDADVVQVTPINASGSPVEVLINLTPINIGEWNSYDIPLTDFTSGGMSINEVMQMKFDVQAGTTGTTLFLDNIYFYSSAPAATEPTASAPTPTQDAGDVISIFSDAYTDLAGTNFNPDWAQSTVVTTEMIDGGNVLKYANTNYQGTQLAGNNDLTGMDYLHVDMWTPDADVVQVTPINASGSPVEVLINLTPINIGEWNSYDIPLTDFTSGGMSINEVMQMKFDVQAGTTGTTLFLDNIYFYSSAPAATEPTASAPTPTQDAGDVISIFSDAYTDLAGTNFNPDWAQSTVVTTEMIDGGNVLKYANTNYQGTQLAGNNDLTGMDYLHVDMWTPDADVVQVTPINSSGSPVEVLINLTPINIGEWNSYDIPLTDFTSGGMSINEVMQMKFDVQAGTTGTTLFLDNIYFYADGGGGGSGTLALPITFEDDMLDYELTDFGGNASMIVVDPEDSGNKVVQTTKGTAMAASETWAGTTVADMSGFGAIPFTAENTTMSVRVWSPASGIPVRLKVEDITNGGISVETEATTTTANAWETLVFDFSSEASGTAALNIANTYDKASIFFNFNTSESGQIYYWDDVEFGGDSGGGGGGGSSVELPVTFENDMLDYELADFGGNASMIVVDPEDSGNKVVQTTKGTAEAASETWAGTTVADMSGFGAIPFTAENTTMSVRVWSPASGIPVRLKVEDVTNGGISVETEATTTMANAWETLVFDFSNQASGTAALNIANTYDKASIFFNFNTSESGQVYYWDDVEFGGDSGGGGGGGGETGEYCETMVYNNSNSAETSSVAVLTIENVDASSMKVTISSGDSDPVDLLIVNNSSGPITGSPAVSAVDESVEGELSITLTWAETPPSEVELNVLWSKDSFEGNWQLITPPDNATVSFDSDCGNGGGGGGSGSDIALPITFEDDAIDYELTDFGGNASMIIVDPEDSGNKVVQSTKGSGESASEVWAGTTVGESSGFGAIPFTAEATTMSVRVWSPSAGIPVRLKVEDKSNSGVSVEAEANTATANAWETLVFDFSNQVAETSALDLNNTYDKASIFFNFGTSESGQVYYWDDVEFGGESAAPSSIATLSSLLVNGESVNRFDTETFEYYMEFPEGTTEIPTVAATATDAAAMVSITNPTELPGVATIIVIAEDESTTNTYTIEYAIDLNLSKVATLSDLQVDGAQIAGFDPEVFEYSIELAETITEVPTVTATTTDANATALVDDAISLPGKTKVMVTAEDGATIRTYSIDFTYPEGTEVTFSVTGTILAGGSPFTEGTVVLYDIDNINNASETSIAADGTYTIQSLAEGSYNLYVASASDSYVTTFYGNVSSVTDANAIPSIIALDRNRTVNVDMVAKPVPAVETVENGATINFQAQSVSDGNSRIVSGRVSQGDVLPNVLVILNTIDGEYVADAVTDSEGRVTFTGIPTGDYKLEVEVPGVGRVSSEISAVEGEEAEFTGLIDEDGIIVNQVLGLGDDLLSDMKVYPNPVVEILNIELPAGLTLRDYEVSIIGLSGRVFNVSSVVRDVSLKIDVSKLEAGVYFIRLVTEDGSADKRFIKR